MVQVYGLKSLDNCLKQAWVCRFYLDNLNDLETHEEREDIGMDVCLCIDKICKLWNKVKKIPEDFLDAVARDNSARFPAQYRPSFGETYYRSWHHFAIITISNAVHDCINIADDTDVDTKISVSKLKLVSRNLNHIAEDDVLNMRDKFPQYSICAVGMYSERDNQDLQSSKNFSLTKPVVLTIAQRAIIKALKGKALTKEVLQQGPCKSMNGTTFTNAIRNLIAIGKVKNDRKIGGYYLPDSPPCAD